MMNKESILEGYDGFLAGKKASATNSKILGFCFLIAFVAVLVWAFLLNQSTIDRIKVVDITGKELKSNVVREEKLRNALIQTHCANAAYYANSFDRITIKENQARAYFLMNKADGDRIFSMYTAKRSYRDALDRGVVYRNEYQGISQLSGPKDKTHVVFTSVVSIYDNGNPVQKFLVTSEGDITLVNPQYPENQSGLYFTNYTQSYEKIVEDE